MSQERNLDSFGTFLNSMEVLGASYEFKSAKEEIAELPLEEVLALANQDTVKTYQVLALAELDKRTAA